MTNFKTVDSFIADLTSSNYFKDNVHLVDDVSIYRWIKMELKKFGRNVMQKKDFVVQIKNNRGETPTDYGQLSLAVYCEISSAYVNAKKDTLLSENIYVERLEEDYLRDKVFFNYKEDCDNCKTEHKVTEKVYLENNHHIIYNYKNPIYVKLGRDVIRGGCTDKCINRNVLDSPYSINIKGDTIYSNFRSGSLYMEYYALPICENGLPIIPYTENGYLEEYLEYVVKRKILEDAVMSGDAANLLTMFQYYVQKEKELKELARQDVSKFSLKMFWNAISKRRTDMAKYEINLGNF